MASKLKKGGEDCKSSWPDLPQSLIQRISWQPTLRKTLSDGGVTKTWRQPPSKQCTSTSTNNHQLQLYGGGHHHCTKVDSSLKIRFGEYFWHSRRPSPKPEKIYYKGFIEEKLVVQDNSSPVNYYNVVEYELHQWFQYLPRWDPTIPLERLVMSSGKKLTLALTGVTDPAFVYQNGCVWRNQEGNIPDPHCDSTGKQKLMRLTNAVGSNGKFFALSMQGTLAVIEPGCSDELKITGLGTKRAVPSGVSRYFKEYLVESNGEVLLIFLVSRRSVDIVDDVEVYELDVERLTWVKKERIGDRTLFLGSNCCMWIKASEMGSKTDFVYFRSGCESVDEWWMYDMRTNSISSGNSGHGILPSISRALDRPKRKRFSLRISKMPLRVFS